MRFIPIAAMIGVLGFLGGAVVAETRARAEQVEAARPLHIWKIKTQDFNEAPVINVYKFQKGGYMKCIAVAYATRGYDHPSVALESLGEVPCE